jgi:hypothetical protein
MTSRIAAWPIPCASPARSHSRKTTGQALRRAEVAEDGDHRARIGGRDDGADEQAGEQRAARDKREHPADEEGRNEHGHHRHHEDRDGILQHVARIDLERSLEKQRRQEYEEEDLGADGKVPDRQGRRFHRARCSLRNDRGGGSDGEADHRENDAGRHAQPRRKRLRQAHHGKQRGDQENDRGDVHLC